MGDGIGKGRDMTYYFLRKATTAERALYEQAEKAGFPGLTVKNGGIVIESEDVPQRPVNETPKR